MYIDIKNHETFQKIEPINKGLSGDQKFAIETIDCKKLMLRISDISQYDRRKTMFDMMKPVAALGVPMPNPVDFGICNDGKSVYQLLTWCEGEELEPMLPSLPESEQYALGLQSGEILRKIHSIPAPENLEDWSVRYLSGKQGRIDAFSKTGIQIEGSDNILRYIEENKTLLKGRPQCFQHGDFHNENLLVSKNGQLSVIDWELFGSGNYGDPWEEFNRIGNSEVVPAFTSGQIHGYFGGEPPVEFWRLLAFYLSAGALMLISWAYYIQNDQMEYCLNHAKEVLQWYNNMQNFVPIWYRTLNSQSGK